MEVRDVQVCRTLVRFSQEWYKVVVLVKGAVHPKITIQSSSSHSHAEGSFLHKTLNQKETTPARVDSHHTSHDAGGVTGQTAAKPLTEFKTAFHHL